MGLHRPFSGAGQNAYGRGFAVLEPVRSGYSPRVKDYQKYLFDFEKETDIPMQVLTQVNEKGLTGFLK